MTPSLRGPIQAATLEHAAAIAVQSWQQLPQAASPPLPGLYALTGGEPVRLAGFWWVFGAEYLETGAREDPDLVLPFVAGAIEGATDAVWWRRGALDREAATWSLAMVLEWLPPLAIRASHASRDAEATQERSAEAPLEHFSPKNLGESLADSFWGDRDPSGTAGPEEPGSPPIPPATLPEESAVAVGVARLEIRGDRHRGVWRLVGPKELLQGAPVVPLSAWLSVARAALIPLPPPPDPPPAVPTEQAVAGRLLELPGGRVGYPIDHWLTRALLPWPRSPDLPRMGRSPVRDVSDQARAQLWQGAFQSAGLLLAIGVLTAIVLWIAQPAEIPSPAPPSPTPVPTLADCSASDRRFVDALRNRIQANLTPGSHPDLRLALCGLLDREHEVPLTDTRNANAGRLAVAQACFEALGEPGRYQLDLGGDSDPQVDPALLLDAPDSQKKELLSTLKDFADSCNQVHPMVEAAVRGAILSAHLAGDPRPTPNGKDLKAWVVERYGTQLGGPDWKESKVGKALLAGSENGVAAQITLFTAQEKRDQKDDGKNSLWSTLGTLKPAPKADTEELADVADYLGARFDSDSDEDSAVKETLWQCHARLRSPASDDPDRPVRWDLSAPMPRRYGHGTLGSQLVLDATLRDIREDSLDLGPCWTEIDHMLAAYKPIYPLLGPLATDGWPSEEQHLCGQICAVAYKVRGADRDWSAWWTRDEDLGRCKDLATDVAPSAVAHRFDALRLPWPGGDRPIEMHQICAFNLIAQGYVGATENPLLGKQTSPLEWAGEWELDPGVAGGINGRAAQAAEQLSHDVSLTSALGGETIASQTGVVDRGNWSPENCRYVAAQCYTGLMLDMARRTRISSWREEWARLLPGLQSSRQWSWTADKDGDNPAQEFERADHPWCEALWAYLVARKGDEDFATGCRASLEETRLGVEAWMDELLAGYASGDKR